MNLKSIFALFSFSKENASSPVMIVVIAAVTFFLGMVVGRKSQTVEPCYSESRMPIIKATASVIMPEKDVPKYRSKIDTLRILVDRIDTLNAGISSARYDSLMNDCNEIKNLIAYDSYIGTEYELEQMYSFSDRTFTHSLRWYGDSLMVTNNSPSVWGSIWDVSKYAFTALVGILVGVGLTSIF